MNLINLIKKLTPKNVHSNKFRMGPLRDGGYIINELIAKHSTKLITFGYGGSDGFEEEWYEKYNTPIDIYDGTCGCAGICQNHPNDVGVKINYYQKNVGFEDGALAVGDILAQEKDFLLKVDIEGAEYTAFDEVDMSNSIGFLLEVHMLQHQPYQSKLIHLMNNEFSCFELFHIHANNHGGAFMANGCIIPTTYELSFVNKNIVDKVTGDISEYPIVGLDFPNDGSDTDLSITNEFNKYLNLNRLFTPVSSFDRDKL